MFDDARQQKLQALDERHEELVRQLDVLNIQVEQALLGCGVSVQEPKVELKVWKSLGN